MLNDFDKTEKGLIAGVGCVWIAGVLVSIAFWIVVIWAIYELAINN